MRAGLKDYFYTTQQIIEEWIKKYPDDKMTDSEFRNRFKNILNSLCIEEKWYKSESAKGNEAIFIFDRSENTLKRIKEVLRIWKETKGRINLEEKNILMENFKELLPIVRTVSGFEDKRKSYDLELDYFIDAFNRLKNSEIIYRKGKEYEELNKYLDKISNLEIISKGTFLFSTDYYDDYYQKRGNINEAVHRYYLNGRNIGFFEDRIFVRRKDVIKDDDNVDTIKDKVKGLYGCQYILVYRWYKKWHYLIGNIRETRIAEKEKGLIKVSDLYGYELTAYERYNKELIKREANEDKQKKSVGDSDYVRSKKKYIEAEAIRSEEECKFKCIELVENILEEKQGKSKDIIKEVWEKDYDYLIIHAFEELEEIREQIIRESDKGKDIKEEAVLDENCVSKKGEKELNNIREYIRKKYDKTVLKYIKPEME